MSSGYLLLFDIDGTLMRCGPVIRKLFGRALDEAGIPRDGLSSYDFAGKIDPLIVRDLCVLAGWSDEEGWRAVPRVRDAWLRLLDECLGGDDIHHFPAVGETLDRLAARSDVELGLLTGNWHRGARIKLRRAGYDHYFSFGAFGGDGRQRRDLPPVALRRASRSYPPERVWIIGDTLHDVDCARAHGLRCLAVETGGRSASELRSAGAHRVVADLSVLEDRWPYVDD
ncbi:MAG: HAD family hydrolase [Acidobacteriota bacterium]